MSLNLCLCTHLHQIRKHLVLYEQLYLGLFLYQNMNLAKYSISHKTQFTLSGATKKKLNISVSSWTVFNNFALIRSSEPFHGTLNLTLNSISISRKIVIITSVICFSQVCEMNSLRHSYGRGVLIWDYYEKALRVRQYPSLTEPRNPLAKFLVTPMDKNIYSIW